MAISDKRVFCSIEKNFENYGVEWLGVVFGLASTYYIGKQKSCGFVFGIVSGGAWLGFGFLTGTWAIVVANVVYVLINIRHLWHRKANRRKRGSS